MAVSMRSDGSLSMAAWSGSTEGVNHPVNRQRGRTKSPDIGFGRGRLVGVRGRWALGGCRIASGVEGESAGGVAGRRANLLVARLVWMKALASRQSHAECE